MSNHKQSRYGINERDFLNLLHNKQAGDRMENTIGQENRTQETAGIGTVDVIIPTYHPDKKFDKIIKRLEKQSIPPRHIYVMNTEDNFFESQEVENYSNITVTHISKYEFDHGGTRNRGAAMSDADFLLFLTQDAVPKDHHLLEHLLEPFRDEQVAAVYARQMADPKENYLEYYTRLFNYPEKSRKKTKEDIEELGIKTFFCSNVCAMYRRTDYEAQGGFAMHAIFNEDMMMAADLIEAGKAVYYAAQAKVWHWHDYTAMEQLRRNFDVAVSQKQAAGLLTQVKSEKEGMRLVAKTCGHLLVHGRFYLIPKVIWMSGFKFIGYKLGQNYGKLPHSWIRKLSLNPTFWTAYWDRQMSL